MFAGCRGFWSADDAGSRFHSSATTPISLLRLLKSGVSLVGDLVFRRFDIFRGLAHKTWVPTRVLSQRYDTLLTIFATTHGRDLALIHVTIIVFSVARTEIECDVGMSSCWWFTHSAYCPCNWRNYDDTTSQPKTFQMTIPLVVTKRYEGQRVTSWGQPTTPTNREHRKLIGVKTMSLGTNYDSYCLECS